MKFVIICTLWAFIANLDKLETATTKQITYFDKPEQDFVTHLYTWKEFSRSGFLCPQNFYVHTLKTYFVAAEEDQFINLNNMHEFRWPFSPKYATKSEFTVSVKQDEVYSCEILSLCLGYQACLWKTSVEICAHNPAPMQRKALYTQVTCSRDTLDLNEKKDSVLYLSATSADDLATIKQTIVPELDVFNVSCPPSKYAHHFGYAGECRSNPSEIAKVIDHLWKILARNKDSLCRKQLKEVYCAYQYNSTGGCIPPSLLESPLNSGNKSPPAYHFNYNFLSLPTPGVRPDMTKQYQIINDPHVNLIPAKLGFLILAHKEPEIVVQLLRTIYRKQFYYVIHIDQRQNNTRNKIAKIVEKEFPKRNNIHVLSTQRSFITSWGSYQIIRAELECFEELLRMGVWDFAINLSGVDLPLRSVDDIASTLASARGRNFFQNHVNGRWKERRGSSYRKKFNTVWYSCGGFVYNVSARETPVYADMYSSSQWAVLSREFAELLVSDNNGTLLNQMQFYKQTSLVPDESYLKTHLMMSNLSHTFRPGNLHTFSPFLGVEKNGQCKHAEDIDFCGQSPRDFQLTDLPTMKRRSTAMLARKFDTNFDSPVRNKTINWVKTGYKLEQRKYKTPGFVRSIAHLAMRELLGSSWKKRATILKVPIIRILPQLIPSDPCCEELLLSTSSYIFYKNRYWIDIIMHDKKSKNRKRIRASMKTLLGPTCFSQGDLLAMRAFGRAPRFSEYNPAMPYYLMGGDRLSLRIIFSLQNKNKTTGTCKETRKLEEEISLFTKNWNFQQEFTYVKLKTNISPILKKKMYFNIWVISPKGNIECRQMVSMYATYHRPTTEFYYNVYETFTIMCNFEKAGLWKIIVTETKVNNPYPYITQFYLVNKRSYDEDDIDNLYGLWKIEDIAIINQTSDALSKSNNYNIKKTNIFNTRKNISNEEIDLEDIINEADKHENHEEQIVRYIAGLIDTDSYNIDKKTNINQNNSDKKKKMFNTFKNKINLSLLDRQYSSRQLNNSKEVERIAPIMNEKLQLWKREITKNKEKYENMQYKRKYQKISGYGLFNTHLSWKRGLFVTGWKTLLIIIVAVILLKWVITPFRLKKMDAQKIKTFFTAVLTIAIVQITVLLLF